MTRLSRGRSHGAAPVRSGRERRYLWDFDEKTGRAIPPAADAYALSIDDGCGGTPYMIDMAYKMIRSGAVRTVAVIGSSLSSPQVNRQVFTSAAGMLILLAEDLERGVVKLGSGDLVAIAAVGANVHYGAQLVRL